MFSSILEIDANPGAQTKTSQRAKTRGQSTRQTQTGEGNHSRA